MKNIKKSVLISLAALAIVGLEAHMLIFQILLLLQIIFQPEM